MKTFKWPFMLVVLLLIADVAVSQDIIIQNNQDTLQCKIREIGSDEIKYALPDFPSDVLFTLTKEKISKLVFANGKEMTFENEMDNPMNYAEQNKNAIKIDFMSPLTGNTTLAYERSIKPGQSVEATLGIIGMGYDPNDYNPRGSFVKFGMKFIKSPDYYVRGMRYAHILKGSYFKPEMSFTYFSKDKDVFYEPWGSQYSTERENYTALTIQLILGKQWVVNDIFLIDFYGGVGYGFGDTEEEYYYGAMIAPEVPLSFSTGLKIGILF